MDRAQQGPYGSTVQWLPSEFCSRKVLLCPSTLMFMSGAIPDKLLNCFGPQFASLSNGNDIAGIPGEGGREGVPWPHTGPWMQ